MSCINNASVTSGSHVHRAITPTARLNFADHFLQFAAKAQQSLASLREMRGKTRDRQITGEPVLACHLLQDFPPPPFQRHDSPPRSILLIGGRVHLIQRK